MQNKNETVRAGRFSHITKARFVRGQPLCIARRAVSCVEGPPDGAREELCALGEGRGRGATTVDPGRVPGRTPGGCPRSYSAYQAIPSSDQPIDTR
jgi:hypothetical protein